MTAALEQTYRRALRWYPKHWRMRNEDAALGTLMDVADGDGRAEPAKGELRNLRASALRTRLEFLNRVYPAPVRDRVAAIAIGTGFAMSVWSMIFVIVGTEMIRSVPWLGAAGSRQVFGPFTSLSVFLYALWILAFVSVVIGLRRVSRTLLALTLIGAFVARAGSQLAGMTWFPSTSNVGLLALFALLGLIGIPRVIGRRWRFWTVLGGAVAMGALTLMLWQQHRFPDVGAWPDFERGLFNRSSDWMNGLMVGFLAALVFSLLLARLRWAAVTAITAAPWVGLHIATGMRVADRYGDQAALMAVAIVGVAGVVGFVLHRSGYRITITRGG